MDTLLKKQYHEQGYLVIKNIVSLDHLHDLYHVVKNVFKKYCATSIDFSQDKPWQDPLFHEAMLRFRTERPELFGHLFDTVQTSTALWRLGSERKICDIAAELMGDSENGLSVTDMLLRMDAPNDTRNKLEWHQDSSYFRQNDLGVNGCVCSMSMRDVPLENGPLEILPGSHSVGRIDVPSSDKKDTITSEQYRIPLDIVERFSSKQILMNAGDAIFFNFDLIHRSGFNASPFFRFTAIARYHRMLTADFKAGRLVYRTRPVAVTE